MNKDVTFGILIILAIILIIAVASRSIQSGSSIFASGSGTSIYEKGFRQPSQGGSWHFLQQAQSSQQYTTVPQLQVIEPQLQYQFFSPPPYDYRSSTFFAYPSQGIITPSGLSPFSGKVRLTASNVASTDPQQEYITLQYSAYTGDPPISLAGWTIEQRGRNRFSIPDIAVIPMNPGVDEIRPILLKPGGIVIISTGKSPRNQNFQLNACTGYFEEFADFYPALPQRCPRPERVDVPESVSDACLLFMYSYFGCQTLANRIGQLPPDVRFESACVEWTSQHLSYAGCVRDHQTKPNFLSNEWRVWLNQTREIWSNVREEITLRDGQGRVVDVISYEPR